MRSIIRQNDIQFTFAHNNLFQKKNFQKLKAAGGGEGHLRVCTGMWKMWKFAGIIVHRNTNRKEANTKLGLAFSSVERNHFNRDLTNFK